VPADVEGLGGSREEMEAAFMEWRDEDAHHGDVTLRFFASGGAICEPREPWRPPGTDPDAEFQAAQDYSTTYDY
jgi:hypothetical protein